MESAQDALDYTNLKAPFEGTVVAIFVENFETVQAKQMIVRLVDDSRIEMLIEIPENLIALTQYVTDITCTFDAFPGVPIPATFKEIGTEASETTRTYPVTLIMDQPQGFKILPGMSGVATGREPLPGKSGDELHIEVPLSAVASPDGSESYVWVIDESTGTVHRRTVTLGGMTTRGLLVGGLEADLWIATAGVHYLQEGQRVRILAAARESPR